MFCCSTRINNFNMYFCLYLCNILNPEIKILKIYNFYLFLVYQDILENYVNKETCFTAHLTSDQVVQLFFCGWHVIAGYLIIVFILILKIY